jgi:hypothetical protein
VRPISGLKTADVLKDDFRLASILGDLAAELTSQSKWADSSTSDLRPGENSDQCNQNKKQTDGRLFTAFDVVFWLATADNDIPNGSALVKYLQCCSTPGGQHPEAFLRSLNTFVERQRRCTDWLWCVCVCIFNCHGMVKRRNCTKKRLVR